MKAESIYSASCTDSERRSFGGVHNGLLAPADRELFRIEIQRFRVVCKMSDQESSIHPGKILLEKVMRPLGVSRNRLARDIGVPVGRISDIVNGKRGITPDTALRLAKYFGTTAELWMRLQSDHDLTCARRDVWPAIEANVQVFAPGESERELDALHPSLRSGEISVVPETNRQSPPSKIEEYETDGAGEPFSSVPLDDGIQEEMGRILQFSTPARLDGGMSAEDQTLVQGETAPSRVALEAEFELDQAPTEDALDIPDPNEFRFRETAAGSSSD